MNSKQESKQALAGSLVQLALRSVTLAISSVFGVPRYGAEDGVGSPPAD